MLQHDIHTNDANFIQTTMHQHERRYARRIR